MIKLIFLILILICSISFANERLRGYQALEQKDYKLAFKSFKFSALWQHPMSRLMLGNMYYQGQGVAVSYPKTFLWWRLAEHLNIDGAHQNINMIKKKMNKEQYILGDKL